MRKEFLIVKLFVMFGYNYSNPDEFLDYICEKTGKQFIKQHLRTKFDDIYEVYGFRAVMNWFFTELDLDLQEALVDYAINVFGPIGMPSAYKEYKSLS